MMLLDDKRETKKQKKVSTFRKNEHIIKVAISSKMEQV